MKKWVMNLSFIPAVVYILLSAAGLGVTGVTGGWIYRLIIIVYLLYVCYCTFSGAVGNARKDVLLSGALGLGLITASEIYSFAYLYLLQGSASDITVSNISRNCAYLFFLAEVICVIPERISGKKALKTSAEVISVIAIVLIFYGEIAHRPDFLYYSALTMMVLCFVPCALCLIAAGRDVKIHAMSIIAIILLDSANRLLIIFDPGWYWRDIVLALYPMAYLFIGYTLIRLSAVPSQPGVERGGAGSGKGAAVGE